MTHSSPSRGGREKKTRARFSSQLCTRIEATSLVSCREEERRSAHFFAISRGRRLFAFLLCPTRDVRGGCRCPRRTRDPGEEKKRRAMPTLLEVEKKISVSFSLNLAREKGRVLIDPSSELWRQRRKREDVPPLCAASQTSTRTYNLEKG